MLDDLLLLGHPIATLIIELNNLGPNERSPSNLKLKLSPAGLQPLIVVVDIKLFLFVFCNKRFSLPVKGTGREKMPLGDEPSQTDHTLEWLSTVGIMM